MSELEPLSLTQTIEKVDNLIDAGIGDTGRLYYILEFLKNNRPLYHSDQIYLENKLGTLFVVEEEIIEENKTLPKIKELIHNGIGDPGRLQHIYDMVADNKPLYHSDVVYLESKLSPPIPEPSTVVTHTLDVPEYVESIPEKLPSKIKDTMPKGWNYSDNSELKTISESITHEEELVNQQNNVSAELDSNRLKLSQLISNRKKHEQKVLHEKSLLQSQIQDEHLRIETQTKVSNDILKQKEELEKIKNERVIVIEKINSEKLKVSNDLLQQKKQLVQTQLEQEKIEKQIKNEQVFLAKTAEDQKLRLSLQTKVAHEIKLKQTELGQTRQDYDAIKSQISKEKSKITESLKLKKLIKSQEKDLIKAKEIRLDLINTISKEKDSLSKLTLEEKSKIQSQALLVKQLKKEEKFLESLQKKHDKIEQQIKKKNQKLKEKQEKIKKQISIKNKKLESLKIKSSSKKSVTKQKLSTKKKSLKLKK